MTAPAPAKAAPIPALLPCPFCGSEAMECHVAEPTVQCTTCSAGVVGETEAEAVATWNGRADRASQEERIREDEPGYLVRIAFREGRSGGLRISSPDVPGLILSHHDEPAILADMIKVLRETDRARLRGGAS